MKGSEIRAAFLKYFEDKGHTTVASSSLIPHNDNTLLFANAGMNQFKDIFLGKIARPYNRATSCQKVVRAGGKHNDLENVGRTSRHHTFFEMLGNFSFGDYFKKDAISYGWNFLTQVLRLPADKMFVTVYRDDDEAFNLWRNTVGLPEDKIYRRGEKDNFWQMGDTGPCGPCSEIYIDQGPGTGCGKPDCNPDCECDRHLELWNLVFMQYNRDENGKLHTLPAPSIDTGMGLERVTSVVQQVHSNYDTDLILPIIDYAAKLAGTEYGEDNAGDVSLRVLADHARSAAFLIADGVLPSNDGKGYVLRRIMRRAMRHGSMLGMESIFFNKICTFVVDFMKDHYVELTDKRAFIEKTALTEEEMFSRTLNAGLKIIQEDILEKLPEKSQVSGEMIFKLYDTHGFPVDLFRDITEDAGLTLDMEGFDKLMARQQERAKKAGLGGGGRDVSDTAINLGSIHKSEFIGYEELKYTGKVLAIIADGEERKNAGAGKIEIITDKTPFYPEGGGQIGDSGSVLFPDALMVIETTYRAGDAIIHRGDLTGGKINVGDSAEMTVNADKRRDAEKNHTATHLLHKALRQSLGEHIHQAGSQVSPDGLRFDFNNLGQITQEKLKEINELVNNMIASGNPVSKTYKSREVAVKEGAVALFGEKYGDTVRVVEVKGVSQELCGGCHVNNTSEICAFVILSEGSVAAGIRRIEAITGRAALLYLISKNSALDKLSRDLKATAEEVAEKIAELQLQIKERDRILKDYKEKETAYKALEAVKTAKIINGVRIVTIKDNNADNALLRNMADIAAGEIRERGIVITVSAFDGKVSFVCRVTPDITGRYKAGALIKEAARITGGTGGGRDDMAQAGGKDAGKIDEALEKLYSLI
ncbi:MAG: alanine--tRNA ligase [Deferribacteraceae bacterium]|jgi:alanyl-tRNA synthetase|nr:alanine--tRNA ligase [Deferribacteraceae bacterium]